MKLFQKIVGVVGVLCLVLGVVRLWFTPAALADTTAPPSIVITETDPADPNPVGVNAPFGGTLEVNPTDSKGHKEDFPGDTDITWKPISITKDGTKDDSLVSRIASGTGQTYQYTGSFTNGGKYEIQFQATVSNDSWSPKSVDAQYTVTVTVVPFIITTPDRYICVGKTKTFSASGGLTPYQWSTEDVNLLKVETVKNQGVVTAISSGGGTINLGAVIMVTDNSYPTEVAAHGLIILDTTSISKQIEALQTDIEQQKKLMSTAQAKITSLDTEMNQAIAKDADLTAERNDLNKLQITLQNAKQAGENVDNLATLISLLSAGPGGASLKVLLTKLVEEIGEKALDAILEKSYEIAMENIGETIAALQESIDGLDVEISGDQTAIKTWTGIYKSAKDALNQDTIQLTPLQTELKKLLQLCGQ